ncbi:Ger(x)C family spore germination protein [Bacillus sp. NTK074B]|uniref:Ger(x)C family spore germination protein n=1 Tax=Bacillus sp. NTK074B TaxID=2802174 RepID=UPI001A9044D3|nr:Ger(x)C family spore germination protein [Bacillus sp. NTK074B]
MNVTKLRLITILFILMGIILVSYVKNNRLDEVELVSGLGVDKAEEGYTVTLQIFNPSANQKNSVDPTGGFTYTHMGRTIPEAIQKMKKESLKEPILDTLQIVVMSEKLVKEEGLTETLDFLIRDPRVPANTNTIILKEERPDVFLNLFTPQKKLSSLYTNTMLKNSTEAWGNLVGASSERIKSYLTDKTSDIVIPYMVVLGNVEKGMSKTNIEGFTPGTRLSLEGFATFKGEKLSSYLTQEESNTLALIKGVDQVVSISTQCPNSDPSFTLNTIKTSSSLRAETDPVRFRLRVKLEGNLEQFSCSKDLNSLAYEKKLEQKMETQIKSDIEKFIQKTEEEGTDVIGLQDALYRQHPDVWEEKRNEKDFLSSPQVETFVDVQFRGLGHIKQ